MKKALSFLLCLVLVFSLCGCSSADYKKAVKLYDAGDYEGALALFTQLGDYEQSADYAVKAQQAIDYAEGVSLFNAGDFAGAEALLTPLGDYADSADYVFKAMQEQDYAEALSLFEAGDYAEAAEIFANLGEFKDSADYAVKAEDLFLSEELVGQWICDVDITELVDEIMAEAEIPVDGDDAPSLVMKFTLDFSEDGRLVLEPAVAGDEQFSADWRSYLASVMPQLMEAALNEAAAENGLTLEDLYSYLGVSDVASVVEALGMGSMDELVDALYQETYDGMLMELRNYSDEGTYTVENGEIRLYVNNGDEPAEYDAESGILTLPGVGGDLDQDIYPMLFTKLT